MTIKYINIWPSEVTEALKSLVNQKMSLSDALALKKFCASFDAERKCLHELVKDVQVKNKNQEELKNEFNLILDKDTGLKKLPFSVLSKLEEISPKDLMVMDALIEKEIDYI